MLKEIIDTLKNNPGLSLGAIAGGIAGIAGGAYLGGSFGTLGQILISGALGLAGAAAGVAGSHFISREVDRKNPAPLGLYMVNEPKHIEPGATVEIDTRPSVELADGAAKAVKTHFSDQRFLPMISDALPYSHFNLHGTGSSDGRSLIIKKAEITIPAFDTISWTVNDVSLPLVDGKIDQENPEAKKQIQRIYQQGIDRYVPPSYRSKATKVLEQTLTEIGHPVEVTMASPATGTEALAEALKMAPEAITSGSNAVLPYKMRLSERNIV